MLHQIEEAKHGKREAFEPIVEAFRGMAYAVAYERLKDPHLAEDATQEAFTEAFLHIQKLKDPHAFPGWFKQIVVRQCNRIVRQKHQVSIPFDQFGHVVSQELTPAEVIERREMQAVIHRSIANLSKKMRIPVLLYYIHGYSLPEISAYLETPVSTLKKRLFDARRKLKGTIPVADFIAVWNDLYEGGTRMLHIVNGDSVAEKLERGSVEGDILVWREVYPEGPIFSNSAEVSNRAIRAEYLEKVMGIPNKIYIDGCDAQEQHLVQNKDYDEIVLWFEHDLFDQTMLCYLLHWFAQKPLGKTKLNLLCIGEFPGIELFRGLGQLSVKQLETLSGTWHSIGPAELKLGERLWEAYASPDPQELIALLEEDTSALPFAHKAFQLHLSRFPSDHNGLGIVEQTTLECVANGIEKPLKLFKQVGDKLHWLGMGDLQYWICLKKISQGTHPLLHIEGLISFPSFSNRAPEFNDCRISLTETGRRVLAGQADWVVMNGMDEWLGGVRLEGRDTSWRWDPSTYTLVDSQYR